MESAATISAMEVPHKHVAEKVEEIDVAGKLGEDKPVWCLYAKEDGEPSVFCSNASALNYRKVEYPNGLHGMQLIQPQVTPKALELLLDFLDLTEAS